MIPKELQERKQWICWKYEKRPGKTKMTKVPYNPVTGFRASSTDASTWTDFETAKKAMGQYSGLGFVFSKDDPYVGIDLDHVLGKDKQFINEDAKGIFDRIDSYAEISPSGTGIHIIGKGHLHPDAKHAVEANEKTGQCAKELYDQGRFFTVTGEQLGKCSEINDIDMMAGAIEIMIASEQDILNKQKQEAAKEAGQTVSDQPVKDPVVDFTQQIFPELHEKRTGEEYQKALHKKAAKVARFIEDTTITKIKKGKDLFITYEQKGRERTAVIEDQGVGFNIPKDPKLQKKYIYTRLLRHVDQQNTWEVYQHPKLEDMHKITQVLVAKMDRISCEAGHREFFNREQLSAMVNEPAPQIWNEILADMGRAPQLSKVIENYNSPSEKGILISKNVVALFSKEANLKLENVQEMASNEEQVKEENFRSVMKDAMITSEPKANFKWMQDHGIACHVIRPENMSDKIFSGCSINDFHLEGKELKGTTFEECSFDGLRLDDTTKLTQVDLHKCRIDSDETLTGLLKSGAVIKDCQVYRMDKEVGKKRWQLVGLEKPKLIEPSGIARKTEKEGHER